MIFSPLRFPAAALVLFWGAGWCPLLADDFSRSLGADFDAGQFSKVEDALQAAVDQDPSKPGPWLELGALRQAQGDNASALAAYQTCLAKLDSFALRLDEAKTLLRLAKLADAQALYLQLDAEKPGDPEILWGMAQVKQYQSQWGRFKTFADRQAARSEAQQWLLKTVKAQPSFALGFWQLAEVSRRLGDDATALWAYRQTVRLDGSFKEAHRRIAGLLARKRDFKDALAKYDQAMAIDPHDEALKAEDAKVAMEVPDEAKTRRQERLAQWDAFTPPAETFLPDSPVTLRVGLARGLGKLRLKCQSDLAVTTPAGTPVTLLPGGREYRVHYYPASKSPTGAEVWRVESKGNQVWVTFSNRLWLTPVDKQKPVALHALVSNPGYFFAREQDKAYRGALEIYPKAGQGFQVINRVSLEQYLGGVIPSEMSAAWPLPALEVQAIVARTYALSKLGRHEAEGFDVCDSVHCQVYGGLAAENPRTNEAILKTAGQVLEHKGKIMAVAFSAQCGGHTQDYQEAWGVDTGVVGVRDDAPGENPDMDFPLSPYSLETWIHEGRDAYCHLPDLRGYQNFRWVVVVKASDLEAKAPQLGRLRRLVVEHRSKAGWADHLLVEGDRGSETLKGDVIRSFLGGIRSNLIWVETQLNPQGWPEAFVIYGGGWGHGVGLCQVGALGLVRQGKGVEEVLRHYFPLADLRRLQENP
ncbi:MAG TPA: SpoIID/LytB domain-containing protein [bacterium]|nr:SpoIID/LytB domain-containing protein [bacterium]